MSILMNLLTSLIRLFRDWHPSKQYVSTKWLETNGYDDGKR